ncbi:MAG: ATP-binding protein [Rhodospirillaceae bacterium]
MRFSIKRILPRSLLGRSLLIIVAPLILLQLITAHTFFERHWDTISRRLNGAVASEVAIVLEHLDKAQGNAIERQWILTQVHIHQDLRFDFLPGETLPVLTEEPEEDFIARALSSSLRNHTDLPFRVDTTSHPERVALSIQMQDGLLFGLIPEKRLFSVTTTIFLGWMVLSSIVLFGVATIFMRNQVRPVRRLAKAADALGKGRDVAVFRIEGAREVRQAAEAFVRMRERINRQIAQRTEMLAGVSHDLRTPITRIKLQLAMMPKDEGTEELKRDIAEMEAMIEGYLAFARGEGTEETKLTNFCELVLSVVDRMKAQGATLDYHSESPISMPLKPQAFTRCLQNIISNAQRYAKTISVRLGRTEHTAVLLVDDDGPGIPKDKREEVFKAFVRLDKSRNPKTGGTGLGLTIARDLVRALGGDIRLEDSPLGGLRVRLTLPL